MCYSFLTSKSTIGPPSLLMDLFGCYNSTKHTHTHAPHMYTQCIKVFVICQYCIIDPEGIFQKKCPASGGNFRYLNSLTG